MKGFWGFGRYDNWDEYREAVITGEDVKDKRTKKKSSVELTESDNMSARPTVNDVGVPDTSATELSG